MSLDNFTFPHIPSQPDLTSLPSSNINMVSSYLNNQSILRSEYYSDEFLPRVSVSPSRQRYRTNSNDAFTISSRDITESYQPRKEFMVIKKHDVTIEGEFDILPTNFQRKYLSTLERQKFVQNSHKAVNSNSHQRGPLQQDSGLPNSHQSSTQQGASSYFSKNAKSSPSSKQSSSLAERRGKRLEHLNPQVMHTLLQSHKNSGQISANSILSNPSSYHNNFNIKSHTHEHRYRRSIILDTTGRVIEKKSPINYSHSLSSRNLTTPSSDGSMLSPHMGTDSDPRIRSVTKEKNWRKPNFSDASITSDRLEDNRDLYPNFSPDEYHSNKSMISPKYNPSIRTSSRQDILIGQSKVIMASSPLSQNFDYIPSPILKPRSRAQTHASPDEYQMSTKNDKVSSAKEDMISSKGSSGKTHRMPPINMKSIKHINSPKSVANVLKSRSENQNSTPRSFTPTLAIKTQSAGTSSDNDLNHQLNPDTHPSNDISSLRKIRSYTISSTRLPSFSLDPSHPGTSRPIILKKIDSPLSSGNNQMTLRMTLTRPDLRADEAKIYGWQDSKFPRQNHYPAYEFNEKFEGKGPFGGPDGWGLEEKEDSKVKKFWSKVTQNLKLPAA